MSFTASYEKERAVILLLINFTLANVTLNLMLSNMAKKPFSLLQVSYLYPLLPVLATFTNVDP